MKQIRLLGIGCLVTLIGCVPTFREERPPQGLRPETDQRITKLSSARNRDVPLIDVQAGNCPVNEVDIPGEGYRVKGGIGGLVVGPIPSGVDPVSPLEVGPQISAQAVPGTEQAAIIVVDDFNGDAEQPGVYFIDQQEGSTLAGLQGATTDEEMAALEVEVAALETNRQYSHGALVFNHTLALLGAFDPNPEPSGIRVFVPKEDAVISLPSVIFSRLGVTVLALDTNNFDTADIGPRLQATIQTLAQQRQRISRFAVNLSFGLVPCSVLADFDDVDDTINDTDDIKASGQPDLTFEEYLQEVLATNSLDAAKFRDDLANILTTPVGTDPLLTGAETDPEGLGEVEISYLAASGNYRLPYSLFPGYWSEFVAVSASSATDPQVKDADYSNTGEVLMMGGYYTLTAYDPRTGAFTEYPNISIAGTSFAAPALSVFTALDFTGATPRCMTPDPASPLAFFKTDPPVAVPLPELDLPLEVATKRYCL